MSGRFIKFAVISLGLIVSHPSLAADNGSNWAGFYIGATAGYGWGSADNSLAIGDGPAPLGANCHFCSAAPPNGLGGNDLGLAQTAGSTNINPNGFVGGLQLGYNWQRANWVYGLEADFQFFDQRQTVNSAVSFPTNSANLLCNGSPCTGSFSNSVTADWLITIRPRVGYVWNNALVYGTAGLAISRLSFSQTYSDNILTTVAPGIGGTESASGSATRVGWTVGAGVEYSIATNWSAKLEYLYVRFDGLNTNGVLGDGVAGDFANFNNSIDHFATNIVRVGINYKFGPR